MNRRKRKRDIKTQIRNAYNFLRMLKFLKLVSFRCDSAFTLMLANWPFEKDLLSEHFDEHESRFLSTVS